MRPIIRKYIYDTQLIIVRWVDLTSRAGVSWGPILNGAGKFLLKY